MTLYRFISPSTDCILEYEAASLEAAIRHLRRIGAYKNFPDLQPMPFMSEIPVKE